MNGAETKMTVLMKTRAARRLVAACAIATAIGGGLGLAAAPGGAVRLVGVSAQGTGKTAAVLIESSEPVAYAVSRPDLLTVLVDLRNVSVADVADQLTKQRAGRRHPPGAGHLGRRRRRGPGARRPRLARRPTRSAAPGT